MFKRLYCCFLTGIMSWKNPSLFLNLKMLLDLYNFIVKVAKEEKPYMVQGALIIYDKEYKKVPISIWAGAGAGTCPTQRIDELLHKIENLDKENQLLQNLLELSNNRMEK